MTSTLTISLVTETYHPEVNGVAMTLGQLVSGLRDRGHGIQLFRPRQSPRDNARTEGDFMERPVAGMRIPFYPDMRMGFPAGWTLRDHWQTNRPDIVYIATEGPLGLSAMRTARRLGIPAVSGFHTNFHSYSQHYGLGLVKPLVEGYLRYFHRHTRCTLAPTTDLCEHLVARGFGSVRVLPRGVDCDLYHPLRRSETLRQQWGLQDGQTAVLYVGRIAAEKNINEAIRAFEAMRAVDPAVRFILVGDGPLRNKLANENPHFHFAGVQTGIPLAEHYASADLFLFPSRTETFGNVTLEAMASGLGVIAYDYAAAHMHIESGARGLLASLHSPDAFTAQAVAAIRNPELCRRMGEAARRHTETVSWQSIVGEFESILRDCITPEVGRYAEEH